MLVLMLGVSDHLLVRRRSDSHDDSFLYAARRAPWALRTLRRAAWRCAVVVLRFARTTFRPPLTPRFVRTLRSGVEGFEMLSSSDTSIPCLRAAARILRRACSFAVFDSNAVWLKRAIALRMWDSSLSGRWPSPFESTYAKTSLFMLFRCRSRRSAMCLTSLSNR